MEERVILTHFTTKIFLSAAFTY